MLKDTVILILVSLATEASMATYAGQATHASQVSQIRLLRLVMAPTWLCLELALPPPLFW